MSRPRATLPVVGQRGPGPLVIRLDARPFLGERQFKPNDAVQMAVWYVMHNLADRPAAGTIRRVELGVGQRRDRGVERRRQRGNVVDLGRHLRFNHRLGRRVETDRIAQVLSIIHSAVSPFTRDRRTRLRGSRRQPGRLVHVAESYRPGGSPAGPERP